MCSSAILYAECAVSAELYLNQKCLATKTSGLRAQACLPEALMLAGLSFVLRRLRDLCQTPKQTGARSTGISQCR